MTMTSAIERYLMGQRVKWSGNVGECHAQHTTNAILHPWLKKHLLAILEQCPPSPEVVPEGRRWQDWDIVTKTTETGCKHILI